MVTDARIINADCAEVLRGMEDASVDAIVTDPPYGLGDTSPRNVEACLRAWLGGEAHEASGGGFMGRAWDSWVPGPRVWRECLRVLKPGGHLLAFAGSRTVDLMGVALRLAGFEVRDCLQWLYGSGFPKSLDVSKAIDAAAGAARTWRGWGTALKPAAEPILMCRKPLIGTVAANVLEHGTGALNIDGCRVPAAGRPLIEARADGAVATYGDGLNGNKATGTTDRGRWPANLVLSHVPSAWWCLKCKSEVGERRTKAGKEGRTCPNCNHVHHKATLPGETKCVDCGERFEVYGETVGPEPCSCGSTSAVFLPGCRQNGKETVEAWECAEGCPVRELGEQSGVSTSRAAAGVSRRGRTGGIMGADGALRDGRPEGHDDTGTAARFFYQAKPSRSEKTAGLDGKNPHPTVKSIALMRRLCRLVTPPGGLVLDPFCGSGTTGCAATLEGFRFVGIEREAEYADIARQRIAWWSEHGERAIEAHAAKAAREAEDERTGQMDMFG